VPTRSVSVPPAGLAAVMLAAAVAGAPSAARAQADEAAFHVPTTNPAAQLTQWIAATRIDLAYHRPRVRGREIFGALVPWDRVWRTGSDNATRIAFSTPVRLNGVEVPAGAYELFSIPSRDRWTVILQERRDQWGSYGYDPAADAARIPASPVTVDERLESFTISVDDVGSDHGTLNVAWDRIRVPVRIEVDLRQTVVPGLEAALRGDGPRPYFLAAMFYYENAIDYARAAELMAKALEGSPGHIGMLHRYALILEKAGDRNGAVRAAEASLAGAREAQPELRAEYTRLNTALLDRLRAGGG